VISIQKRVIGSRYLTVFLFVFALYLFTLAPGLVWQDQGDYQLQVAKLVLSIPGDAVRVHPLYIIVSHAFCRLTGINFALGSNIMSALFGAFACANVFGITRHLTRRTFPAALAALLCAFGHTTWFMGTQAQTYSLSNAAMSAGIWAALHYAATNKNRSLYLCGFFFGLGLGTHLMSQIALAVIGLWLLWRLFKGQVSLNRLLLTFALWMLGAAPIWIVAGAELANTGSISETFASLIWGRWGNAVFNAGRLPLLIKRSAMFFVLNFPTPLVLLSIPGIHALLKRKDAPAFILLGSAALYFLFAVRYDVPNQNHFFMPFYMLIAIFCAAGFAALFPPENKKATIICTALLALIIPAYPAIATVAEKMDFSLGTHRHIPYRPEYKYYIEPWQQGQTGPVKLVSELFSRAGEGAVLFVDSTPISAFEYAQQIEGHRPDIVLGSMNIDYLKANIDELMHRPLYSVCKDAGYSPEWVPRESFVPIKLDGGEVVYRLLITPQQWQQIRSEYCARADE
jgi:hypothetical protein